MERLQILVGPSSQGGYSATVPGLSGCTFEAESREEAIAQVQDALELVIDSNELRIEVVEPREH